MNFRGGGGGGGVPDPLSPPLDPRMGKPYEKNYSTHNTNNQNHPEGAVWSGFTAWADPKGGGQGVRTPPEKLYEI